jgi:hypothetical protein
MRMKKSFFLLSGKGRDNFSFLFIFPKFTLPCRNRRSFDVGDAYEALDESSMHLEITWISGLWTTAFNELWLRVFLFELFSKEKCSCM